MATFDSSGVGSDVSLSYSPQLTVENNIITVAMGDGYEKRLKNGINASRRTFSLSFLNRSDTVTTNILNFLADPLKGNNGAKAFDWTPPFGSTGKWVCQNPSVTMVSHNLNDIELVFREVFEP